MRTNNKSEKNLINLEIKKINKTNKEIEWTDTLEIPYEKEEKENKKINSIHNRITSEFSPFHEPDMNTIEFENQDTTTVVNLIKKNNEKATIEEKTLALKTLLENKVISQKEYDEKMKQIISEISK